MGYFGQQWFYKEILLTGVFLLATCSLTFGQPAQLWETGQTICYDSSGAVISCAGTGQDGEIKAGVAWPNPRFTVSGDCVSDNLTGLMWARNANLPNGTRTWQGALDYVASMNSGSGLCGYHDWRLPNRKELRSLIDYSQYYPALPLNHPFINVQSYYYWSSSSYAAHQLCLDRQYVGWHVCTATVRLAISTFGRCVADRVDHFSFTFL